MQDVNAPESLRDFQIGYGRYLRDPQKTELPEDIPARRSEIYENLLFNNISGFINSCFPVSKSLFDEQEWLKIRREFFSQWRCVTPIFSQIPYEFVRFISERPIGESLPPFLSELLHYEWVELEVDVDVADVWDDAARSLMINPTAKLLAYQWPVHKISPEFQPSETQQTCLVVYRDEQLSVRFSEVNPTTLMLLQFMQESNIDSERQLHNKEDVERFICRFGEQINHPEPKSLLKFGFDLLQDLKQKNILIGDIS